jgi:hypothetical protein
MSEGEFHGEAMVQLSKKETTLGLLLRSIVGPEKGWAGFVPQTLMKPKVAGFLLRNGWGREFF